jgi:hypothetical protein
MEFYATDRGGRERCLNTMHTIAFLRHSVAASDIAEPATALHQFVNYITGMHHFL